MRILKKIALVLAAFIGLILIVALFLPSSFRVERSTGINAPVELVFAQVADFSKWPSWDPWVKQDPKSEQRFSGTAGQIGHSRWWKGNEIGEGSMTIQQIVPNKSIQSVLDFKEPAPMKASDSWTFESTDNGTFVTWVNQGELDYPIGRLFGLMLNNMLGGEMESGLKTLKNNAENSDIPLR